jgi:hypothetical protein
VKRAGGRKRGRDAIRGYPSHTVLTEPHTVSVVQGVAVEIEHCGECREIIGIRVRIIPFHGLLDRRAHADRAQSNGSLRATYSAGLKHRLDCAYGLSF